MGCEYHLGCERSDLQECASVCGEFRGDQSVRIERLSDGRCGCVVRIVFVVAAARTGQAARHRAVVFRFGVRHPAQPDAFFVGAVDDFAY